jgi:hypothetical protein
MARALKCNQDHWSRLTYGVCPFVDALDDFLLPKPKILKPLPPATAAAVVLPEDQGYRNRYNLIDRPSGNGNFGEKNKGLWKILFFYQFTKPFQQFEQNVQRTFLNLTKVLFYMSTINKMIHVSIALPEDAATTSGLDPFLAAKSWKLIGGAEALRGLLEWFGPFIDDVGEVERYMLSSCRYGLSNMADRWLAKVSLPGIKPR